MSGWSSAQAPLVGLYICSGQLQLPLPSFVEEYKIEKGQVILSLRDFKDEVSSGKRDLQQGLATSGQPKHSKTRAFQLETNLFQVASYWELRADVGQKLQFLKVVHTALSPDIVLWSVEACKIIIIELL